MNIDQGVLNLTGRSTPTGIPIIDCAVCGYTHPETRKHCEVCGLATLIHNHTKENPTCPEKPSSASSAT